MSWVRLVLVCAFGGVSFKKKTDSRFRPFDTIGDLGVAGLFLPHPNDDPFFEVAELHNPLIFDRQFGWRSWRSWRSKMAEFDDEKLKKVKTVQTCFQGL